MPKKNTTLVPMKENKLLVEVIMGGFMGALAGIIMGLFLGLVVWGIVYFIVHIEGGLETPPAAVIGLMGMGFGAIIGAIFGCIAGEKQQK